ncbi:MAG TPA: 3-dehydroquinate synthase [Candidatus Marinimicrobia bacterium]|nr:3-dehydroquinate synthase [Candidatus Neomarinimicrobiota bacterium]
MNNIFLIGFMGSGKDSVGREIARRSGLTFLSSDAMIELSEGQTIGAIFSKKGEAGFRRLEKRALRSIKRLQNVVIATGGGLVIDEKNRRLLSRIGTVIHLAVDSDTVKQRLRNDRSRPLLKEWNAVERLLSERKGIYDFADVVVETSTKTPGQIAETILSKVKIKEPQKTASTPGIIDVKTPTADYKVAIGEDAVTRLAEFLPFKPKRCAIISNPLAAALYLDTVTDQLNKDGVEAVPVIIPDGEQYKNLKTVSMIYDVLLSHHFDRSDLLIGRGGGVITDIAGFVAATLKRGCRLIHIPTTLLAQVDAGIGGKTGVNHSRGKNLIGSFYQPELVLADINFLQTLPDREFRNALAEVIKIAMIRDKEYFEILENHHDQILARDPQLLQEIVTRAIRLKRDIIQADEKELNDQRALLNFGHTVGHVFEAASRFRGLKHGEAVAIGMVWEARFAGQFSGIDESDIRRLVSLIDGYGLPVEFRRKLSADLVQRYIIQDKKVRNGKLNLPVVSAIGKCHIKEIEWEQFLSFMDQI